MTPPSSARTSCRGPGSPGALDPTRTAVRTFGPTTPGTPAAGWALRRQGSFSVQTLDSSGETVCWRCQEARMGGCLVRPTSVSATPVFSRANLAVPSPVGGVIRASGLVVLEVRGTAHAADPFARVRCRRTLFLRGAHYRESPDARFWAPKALSHSSFGARFRLPVMPPGPLV